MALTVFKQIAGFFAEWSDARGARLISLNRDGSIFMQSLTFADGTSQTTAASAGGTNTFTNTSAATLTSAMWPTGINVIQSTAGGAVTVNTPSLADVGKILFITAPVSEWSTLTTDADTFGINGGGNGAATVHLVCVNAGATGSWAVVSISPRATLTS